ncbi:MAG: YbhB/YbcL family Raf kinase inhibitor-like protein [Planctomycetota bacterium]|nr:YbhB/YbcL family Raf kinase inhibitor-like protein [Planctomycetota bacterium]
MIRQSAGNLPVPATFEPLESRILLDNSPPVVDDQAFSVDENSAAGTVVGTVLATDPDAGDGLTYSITDGNTGTAFAIDAATGEITVAGMLDYETLDNFVLTVGTVVGTVVATDADVGQTLAYAITEGNTGDAFAIDPATGELTVAGTLDPETQNLYVLTVEVADDATPSLSDTATVTIGFNDAPVVVDQGFNVDENSTLGAIVGTVQATDANPGQTLTYAITGGNTGNAFAIDSATGQITVAGAIDYETLNIYILTVQVTDDGTPSLSDTAAVTMAVNDVNDAPVVNNQAFNLNENSPLGTVVGTVLASDPDAGQTLAYVLTDGNTGNAFAINHATGQITVAGTLDHEMTDTFAITVRVTDNGTPSQTSTATVTIAVNDVNEAPVVNDQAFTVNENSAAGTVVGTVQAYDVDAGQTLTYVITNGNTNNAFAINAATGQITVAGTLNHEVLDSYTLTVQVTDNGTLPLYDTATVTIGVNDVNEAPVASDHAFNVDENSVVGTVVGTVLASDPDAGQTLVYAITGGNTGDAFAINAATGQITVAGALDHEVKATFALTVQVTDDGTPPLTDTATVTITINDINETLVEVAKLDHLLGGTSEQFGFSAAIDRDLAVVGDPKEDTASGGQDAGAVRVYQRVGSIWNQVAYLTASDAAAFDGFGTSVAIDGSTILVGAPGDDLPGLDNTGSVYVFQRTLAGWTQTARITAPDLVLGASLGWSVSVSGDWALVGAPWDGPPSSADDGSAYFFRRSGTTWTQVSKFTPPVTTPADAFGYSVSIEGNLAVIGAPLGGTGNGAVYVYQRLVTGWQRKVELPAPTGAQQFGKSVATDGLTVLVGAPAEAGAAYLFSRAGTTWTQTAKLTDPHALVDTHFGTSVTIDGGLVLIGAADTVTHTGSVHVFQREGAAWGEAGRLTTANAATDSQFGWAVGLDGNRAIVGADTDDTAGAQDAGAAYVFEQTPAVGAFAINGPVPRGDKIALAANNVQPSNGAKVTTVRFYRDVNASGTIDAGDLILGAGVKQTGTTNYRLAVPTMGTAVKLPYALGEHHFLVEVVDSNGVKIVVPATVTVENRRPTIASLTTNAKSYKQGAAVTLTAKGVADLDGTVTKVEFYVDADGDGALDLPGDTKIGEQTVGKYGAYTVTYTLAGDAVTAPTRFFAVATDNGDARSIAATATVPVIPTVSIEATDNQAAETVLGEAANPATFTIRRSGTRGNLTVKLAASGTARFGPTGDYTLSVGATNLPALSVVIPNGADNVVVTINPVDNIQVEPTETVILTLLTNAAYVLDPAPAKWKASATIADNDATALFTLTSTAFANGLPMASSYSAHGGNISPPLAWANVPGSTKQLLLIVDDPDGGGRIHWILYKIPASVTSIAEETIPAGAVQGINWLGGSKYDGPDPPHGPAHRYDFRLYALNTELALGAGLSKAVLTGAMTGHIVAMAELVGTYQT